MSEGPDVFVGIADPPWARAMKVRCNGLDVEQPKAGRRVLLSRTWRASTTIDVEFVAGLRIVSWPAKDPSGVALFDGPPLSGPFERDR